MAKVKVTTPTSSVESWWRTARPFSMVGWLKS